MGIKDLKGRNNRTYLNCMRARKASSQSDEVLNLKSSLNLFYLIPKGDRIFPK